MMKTNHKQIVKDLQTIWPSLIDNLPGPTSIALADKDYWMITKAQVKEIVSKTWFEKYHGVVEGFDCDDYALLFYAFVVQERYKQMRESGETAWLPWAIGIAWGSMFDGRIAPHAVNIAITRDAGIILIEASNDKVWIPTSKTDLVYFAIL